MNWTVFDVTDIPGTAVGDAVILLGTAGDQSVSAAAMAAEIGTIGYEVLCVLGGLNRREYVEDDLNEGMHGIEGEEALTDERTICAVCAWRGDCLKKFSFESSGQLRCPDYCRDLTIKPDDDDKGNE
jgi:hypothetical protein